MCVQKRTMLPRGSENIREIVRRGDREERGCDREFTVCNLFWLGPVASEELAEEVAHDHVLMRALKRSSELPVIY